MKEIFENTLRNTERDGIDKLISWVRKTDFYTAPASTKYHLAKEGGLLQHSLNVCERLCGMAAQNIRVFGENTENIMESAVIVSLLHDVCKINIYKTEMRNVKNENGKWEQVPTYIIDDEIPYGHGEKSVYIVSSFIKLTREEAMAIRWHMGGFDESVKAGLIGANNMNKAFNMYPLAAMLHIADLEATYIDERGL